MKQRGLIVIHQFRPVASGAELQAERLAMKLVEMGHPMQVFTQLRTPDSLPEENLHGIQVHRVEFPLAYDVKTSVVDTFRYLVQNRHSYDIIHVQQAFGHAVTSVVAARAFGKKCIIKIACAGEFGDLHIFSSIPGFNWAVQILHQADRIIAISREVEDELRAWGFPVQRICRIPNGVDTHFFQRHQPLQFQKRVRFILPGRRHPQKGIDVALQATQLLVDQGLGDRLEIKFYGVDYPEHDYYFLARELRVTEWVEFLPFTEAMKEVYQSAHCLILPSRGEGMSNALLEAMAMELPVIATAVSGTVDIITDGVDGLLIRPDSAEELAQAMATIIQDTDLAQKLGQRAREKMVAEFSMESVARQYSELYQQLCSS